MPVFTVFFKGNEAGKPGQTLSTQEAETETNAFLQFLQISLWCPRDEDHQEHSFGE